MKGRCLAAALAATLLSLPASAQSLIVDEATIGLRAKLPRSGVALHGAQEGLDAWLPCEVVLSNPGKEELSGSLQLHESPLGATRRPITYERQIILGPGAHKRLSFPVLYDGTTNYWLEFHDERLGELELSRNRAEVHISIPHQRATSEKLVLFARRPGEGRRLDGFQPPPEGQNQLRDWLVAEIDPSRLPIHGLSYHRVDAVILDDVSLDQLSAEQQRALVEYVARGGILWVSMLTRKPGAQSAALQAILPGRPLTVRELDEIPSLESFSDLPIRLRQTRSFMTFEPRARATVWGKEQVVLHRRHDQGWVLLAGFRLSDKPLVDAQILLRQLLRIRSRSAVQPPTAYTTRLRRALARSLRGTTRKAVPALSVVVSLLGGYLLLVVALPFAALRRSGRFELAWIFVAVVAFGGVAAVDLLGRGYEQASSAVRVSVVGGGADAGVRRRTSYWAVFSEKGGPLPVRFADGAPTPFPMRGSSEPLRSSGELEVTLETHPQDTTLFVSSEPRELRGGLRFSLEGPTAARLSIQPGGLRLSGAWAWDHKGRKLRLDTPRLDVAPSEELFAGALEVIKSHAIDVAQREQRPVLLYRYDGGGPTLADLPENALDVGLLLLDPIPSARQLQQPCERIQTAEATRDNDWMATWSFSLQIPRGMTPSSIIIEPRRRWRRSWTRQQRQRTQMQVALYDWRRQSWRALRNLNQTADDLIAVSPLGVARGRLTIKSEDEIVPEIRLRLERTQ